MKKLLAIILALMTLTSTACAEELTVLFRNDLQSIAMQAFQSAYPDVTVTKAESSAFPENASTLAGRMLTREFDCDVFAVSTWSYLPGELIDKGYVLDLSGSDVIREAVGRMHPVLQDQVTRDGKIFGFPQAVDFQPSPLLCNDEAWEELGFTEADIPQSFADFLDFLDAWVERQQTDPQDGYWVLTSMDEMNYDSAYYTGWLTNRLMENYILQKQFVGDALTFDEPELLTLLKRVRETGAAIYRIEPARNLEQDRTPLFFTDFSAVETLERWQVPLRLHREQPNVVSGSLYVVMAYAGTESPEAAVAYIESIVRNNGQLGAGLGRYYDTRLYPDAQPIVNDEQEALLRQQSNHIAMLERRLADDKTPWEEYLDLTGANDTDLWLYAHAFNAMWDDTDIDARDALERYQQLLEQIARQTYRVSPEELEVWQRFIQTMYFPGPSAFSLSTDVGWNFQKTMDQFAEGVISAEQLLQDAARIAWMVEMENQ